MVASTAQRSMVATMTPADALSLASSQGMSATDASAVLDLLMDGAPSQEEGGAILKTWAERGVTASELAAVVKGLKGRCAAIAAPSPVIDVVGTGGSGLTRYNTSTTSAFILAASGITVAKHGNMGSRRPNGSFDLLQALDIPFMHSPENISELLHKTGQAFLFARTMHPAMKAVVPYRQAAACRTVFNLAGPLANPVALSHQVIGACDQETAQVLADALLEIDDRTALVVWGHPGLDEVSVTGSTGFLKVADGSISTGSMDEVLHPGLNYEQLPGGDGVDNAVTFKALMAGTETGPIADMVTLSAGIAFDLMAGREPTVAGEGQAQARDLLASGAAAAQVERYRELAQSLG